MSPKGLAIKKILRWIFLLLIALSAVEYLFGSVGHFRNMLGESNLPLRESISWPKRTKARPQYDENWQPVKEEFHNTPNIKKVTYKTLNSSDNDTILHPNSSISSKLNTEVVSLNNETAGVNYDAVEQIGISNVISTKENNESSLKNDTQTNTTINSDVLKYTLKSPEQSDKVFKKIDNKRMQALNLTKKNLIQKQSAVKTLKMCPEMPPNLVGELHPNLDFVEMKELEQKYPEANVGGWYRPKQCLPKDKVAIIVPFRNREPHLSIFLNNLHPFLMKQNVEYGIFVIEQDNDNMEFNRGALFNVGFMEAQKAKIKNNESNGWDCFIFHDVDLIPLDDRNIYKCPKQPRHMSPAIDKYNFKLAYQTLFGGVSAMTTSQFMNVNGFSNKFWGWGGEDDEMSGRLRLHGYHIARYPMTIARYTMLEHRKAKANPKRYEIMTKSYNKSSLDGVSTLDYSVKQEKLFPLYSWYLVRLNKPS